MQAKRICGHVVPVAQQSHPDDDDPSFELLTAVIAQARKDAQRKRGIAHDDKCEAVDFLEWCQKQLCD